MTAKSFLDVVKNQIFQDLKDFLLKFFRWKNDEGKIIRNVLCPLVARCRPAQAGQMTSSERQISAFFHHVCFLTRLFVKYDSTSANLVQCYVNIIVKICFLIQLFHDTFRFKNHLFWHVVNPCLGERKEPLTMKVSRAGYLHRKESTFCDKFITITCNIHDFNFQSSIVFFLPNARFLSGLTNII